MITFSKLGRKGNIGNQLFQIASVIGIAKTNNQEFAFPSWKVAAYFENDLPVLKEDNFNPFYEKHYHYEPIQIDAKNYDLEGWFQSEKYFGDRAAIKEYFKFKEELVSEIRQQFQAYFDKKTILISIRRGDFVDHKDYFQLPINFYLNALLDHFPNYKDCSILVLSDDINYCKYHFSSLENVFFGDSLNAVEQLILASLCDDFIISNSTFSWWCAWLGEKKDSKIIRPLHNFSEEKRQTFNDKDYFPDRWIAYDFANKKVNLSNVALVLRKPDALLESYFKHYFNFLNQNNFEDYKDNLDATSRVIFINNCLPSPVAINQIATSTRNSIFYRRGNWLKISKVLDKATFTNQFDFGIFARLLGKKELITNELIMICTENEKHSFKNILQNVSKITIENESDNDVNYCFSGKIISFFEFRFYLITKTEKWIRSVKKDIKKRINYKKK